MLIAISQRHNADHNGTDALEASYVEYFSALGVTLIPVPNNAKYVQNYFDGLHIDGIILSGGGDIQPELYGGKPVASGNYAPARDDTEKALLAFALEQDIPVLGICRGMEFLNVYFGGKLQSITDVADGIVHDETRHDIMLSDSSLVEAVGADIFEVNSYHRMVIGEGQLAPRLTAFATATDRTTEGFYHPEFAIAGIVWHPEREVALHALNKILVDAFLLRKLFWQQRKETTV
jgi:gamma-glutamyl-gamma-aminobutyrate hydrolase PuuD